MTKVFIFTDGSATAKDGYSRFDGSFGYIAYQLKEGESEIIPVLKGGGYREGTTVPRCELLGILRGLEVCIEHQEAFDEETKELIIVTDSQLSRDTLMMWLPNWIKKARKAGDSVLRTGSGTEAKNQDILMKIYNIMENMDIPVVIHHINSHLDTKGKIDKAYTRYNRFNGVTITLPLFLQFAHANTVIDHNVTRYYEEKLELDKFAFIRN